MLIAFPVMKAVVLVLVDGAVSSALALNEPDAPHELLVRVAGAIVIFGASVLVGTAFIVSGQLVLVFLDMRARLKRIDRRLRDWGEATKQSDEPPLAEMLRPR
jgi:hypothetical protein